MITLVAFILWRFLIPEGAASFCVHNLSLSRSFVFSQGLLLTFRYLKTEFVVHFDALSVKECWLY